MEALKCENGLVDLAICTIAVKHEKGGAANVRQCRYCLVVILLAGNAPVPDFLDDRAFQRDARRFSRFGQAAGRNSRD